MKIALVITELYPGGAERCFVQLALYLRRQGHEVAVWQLWPEPPPERNELVHALLAAEIEVHSCQIQRAWQFPGAILQLRKQWRKFQPEVVQAFLFHANLAAAVASPKQARLFGGARVRQPEKSRQWLQGWAAHRMERLVAVSTSVANHNIHVEKIASEKIAIIPNGIDVEGYAERATEEACWSEFGLAANARVLLYVGRLADQKGVLPFAAHLESLLHRLPDHEVVFMGDGEQRESLQTLTHRNPHASRIHLVGWHANTAKWLCRSECLLLPALYEGMPNVILEAMAAARPFVSFDVDGIQDLVGETALLQQQCIAGGDYDRFCSAVVDICNSHELADSLGSANQQRIKDAFDLDKQLLKYQELYECQTY